jgi:TP901 family phage tail tape measure protein
MPPGADQTAVLSIIIRARNEATAALRSASSDVSGLQATMVTAGRVMLTAGAAIGGALAAGLAATVGPAMQFDQTMSGVQAVTGATAAQMDQLRNVAMQLGKDTVFSASEAGQAIEELAKGGISTADILNGAAAATVNLAAAGQVSLPQAATIAANAMNIFGISGQNMAHVTDMIAGAANASSLEVGDFAYSLQYAGAFARSAGVSFDDLAVAIAEMGQQGITGSAAGTQLSDFLVRLQPHAGAALKTMIDLGLATRQGGNAFVDASGRLKSMADIQQILQNATAGLTDAQRAHDLQLIFGMQGQQAANILLRAGAAGYNEMAAAMARVTAQGVASARLNNLAGDLTNLSGSLETLRIQLGEGFGGGQGMPAFRALAQNINAVVGAMIDWTKAHGPLLARLMPLAVTLGGAAAAALLLGGAFTLMAAALSPVSVVLAAVVLAMGGLAAAWATARDTTQRATTDMSVALQVQAARWAETLGGWVGRAWAIMQPALGGIGTNIVQWLNGAATLIERNAQAWATALWNWIIPANNAMPTKMGSFADAIIAWANSDGTKAMLRAGNALADALVAAIVEGLKTALPRALAKLWNSIPTPDITVGGVDLNLSHAVPWDTHYTGAGSATARMMQQAAGTPSIGPLGVSQLAGTTTVGVVGASEPIIPSPGAGANAVPYGSRGIIPGAADTWNKYMQQTATTLQSAGSAVATQTQIQIGSAARNMRYAAQVAADEFARSLQQAAAIGAARQAIAVGGAGAQSAAQASIIAAPTTLGTGNQQTAGSTQLLGGGGPTINITVSVGTGAVQVQQGAGPRAEAQTRDYGLKVGEAIADALARFARAERTISTPPRPTVAGARG